MIKQAAFNGPEPEVWNVLTDDDHIVDFHAATKALRSSLQSQLTTYKMDLINGLAENVDWYGRTNSLYTGTIGLLQPLRPKVKDRDRRHYDRLGRIRYKLLRRAIIAHRKATLAGGEPTEQDRLLWAALVEAWATGSDGPQPGGKVWQ
jgi:hypothetical protein